MNSRTVPIFEAPQHQRNNLPVSSDRHNLVASPRSKVDRARLPYLIVVSSLLLETCTSRPKHHVDAIPNFSQSFLHLYLQEPVVTTFPGPGI